MATLEAPPRLQVRLHEGPFKNEPFVDFTKEENVRKMRAAIEKVRGQLGREYDLIIGGKRIKTTDKIRSINPAKPSEVVGIHQKAGKEHVEPAMQAALKAFEHWSRTSVEERASLLFRVADMMRERKLEYMAWLVFEVSKNWFEADADISETIDFCEFYAREALRFAKAEPPIQLPGERDTLMLHSAGRWRGDSAVEFCLRHHGRHDAGFDGQRQHGGAEALERFADHCREVRRTAGRMRHARGRGEFLPRRRRELWRRAGGASEDALHRFHRFARSWTAHQPDCGDSSSRASFGSSAPILEMGGKDAIIVDADADIDSAVEGVAAAAFGFQGQKCSACSRAIVDERIYDKFVEQLKARVEKITVGDPALNPTWRRDQRRVDERHSPVHRDRQERGTAHHRRRARHQAAKAISFSRP